MDHRNEINDFPGEINLHSVIGDFPPSHVWNQRVVHKNLRLPILFCARASWCRSHDFLLNAPRQHTTGEHSAGQRWHNERSTISNGRTHYIWDIFNSYIKSSVITSYYLQYLIVKQMMRHCHVETMKGKNKANSGQIPIFLDDGISSTSIA